MLFRSVDDETPGVTFGKGWRERHNANGGQVGDVCHMPPGGHSWGVNFKPVAAVGDAVYPLPVKEAGRYTLMGRVPYLHSATMDSKTAMEICSGGKVTAFTVNQSVGTGTWQRIGEFDLAPGATLTILPAKSYGTVIADGFALVPMER